MNRRPNCSTRLNIEAWISLPGAGAVVCGEELSDAESNEMLVCGGGGDGPIPRFSPRRYRRKPPRYPHCGKYVDFRLQYQPQHVEGAVHGQAEE
ncbi:MAG: hypothetical protein GY854_00590 [Deltaproteobacteria bacterium]|nr:hypothetical protein [Deltaproteobacteria bacterium]